MKKLITTSWDDGHVLDLRLAELLQKYKLPATFYIPQINPERAVMPPHLIQSLAKSFEIGGHTLHHVRLRSANKELLEKEIKGSYIWLGHLLGESPVSFCFPGGVFDQTTVKYVFSSGYQLARTTELLSTTPFSAGCVTGTTLQVYPHAKFTYTRHLVKRKKWITLFDWLKNNSETELVKLAEFYLGQVNKSGGCFHLWGHSWEIDEYNLWGKLEELFKVISARIDFAYVQNKGLI
ncbi:MAG TPA: polysaccharide deacetylase family protein [Flavisolibacter sp.]|nr:polysaccharide deacetylase family protein [Flavisolibacter sp.]